jgi:hypothetical protein
LKEEKSWNSDKQDNGRLVHMFFVDLESEHEVEQSFFDLKAQLQESTPPLSAGLKSKLIFYSRESHLLEIINRAALFGIDLNQSPLALYSSNVHPDLSEHLGTPFPTQAGGTASWASWRCTQTTSCSRTRGSGSVLRGSVWTYGR